MGKALSWAWSAITAPARWTADAVSHVAGNSTIGNLAAYTAAIGMGVPVSPEIALRQTFPAVNDALSNETVQQIRGIVRPLIVGYYLGPGAAAGVEAGQKAKETYLREYYGGPEHSLSDTIGAAGAAVQGYMLGSAGAWAKGALAGATAPAAAEGVVQPTQVITQAADGTFNVQVLQGETLLGEQAGLATQEAAEAAGKAIADSVVPEFSAAGKVKALEAAGKIGTKSTEGLLGKISLKDGLQIMQAVNALSAVAGSSSTPSVETPATTETFDAAPAAKAEVAAGTAETPEAVATRLNAAKRVIAAKKKTRAALLTGGMGDTSTAEIGRKRLLGE